MSQASVKLPLRAVLFDLDGTLVDSAPDLAGTANDMRVRRNLEPLSYRALRSMAGSGARGMLALAFDTAPGQAGYERLRDEFHDLYEQRMLRETTLFAAVVPVLDSLDRRGLAWGIVTNKALRFASPLASALGLWPRARVLVAGDTTPHTKPHPAPLFEAARQLSLPAACCTYVGDDERDMLAARAAGMGAIAAAWGYLGAGGMPNAWGADAVLDGPDALLQFLELA
jgi:N-acetyl-D-muramate 6-phosphate phosphatase